MRYLSLYLLALIISVIEVAMYMSVILLPLLEWLMEKFDWFADPLCTAYIVNEEMKTIKAIERANKKREGVKK